MNVWLEHATSIAHGVTDDIVDAVEAKLGIELSDNQWEQITAQIEGDLAESIQDAFADVGK